MNKKSKKFNIYFFKEFLFVNSNSCLKKIFLFMTLIIFSFVGCERNKPSENSNFKKELSNKPENSQKKKRLDKGKKKSWSKFGGKVSNKKKNNIRVMKVKPDSFNISKTYVGYLLPNNRVLMRSEIDGVIEKIYFEEGNKIVKEKRMIEISTKELQLKMNIAIANANLAKINIERDEKLAEKNLISNAQLDQSRTQSESANLNKELAKINLKKSLISSPLNGTIKTRFVKIGEFVRKGDKLAEILDLSRVIVKINIPEQDILDIKIGQEVSIALYILEDTNFLGKVKNIGLEADSNNRTFPVEIDVDNLKRKLRPGMLARATFTKKISENQIVIPRHTILEKEEGRVVYVFEKGKVLQRYIEVGLTKQDQVQILNGLKNGEMIVVEGHTKLSDGEDVNVVK
tara:strand:- start:2922 stop:4124 length:1203 start_codon:yes stop_codon:yes gene_type:complete